jgi:hypothetical protein
MPAFFGSFRTLAEKPGYTYRDFGIQLHSGTIYPRCVVASSFSALPAAGGLFNLNEVHG